MPHRKIVAQELADVFRLVAHGDRIRLIEELRSGECDVNSLAERLDLSPSRISQHLSLLRAHRLVTERREGRRHLYSLAQPEFAQWVSDGIAFLEQRIDAANVTNLRAVRALWS